MSQILETGPDTVRRGRGRPKLAPAAQEELRARVLGAAESLFADRGVGATSIDDIARGAGTSRATLYRIVGSKDDIVLAVALRRYDEWVDGLLAHVDGFTTAADILVEAVLWTMRSVRKEPSLGALFTGGTAPTASNVLGSDPSAVHRVTRFSRELADRLAPHASELRAGLHPEVVGDRVLNVMLERLRREGAGAGLDLAVEREWLAAWLLPAVLTSPPPVPARYRRAPRRPHIDLQLPTEEER